MENCCTNNPISMDRILAKYDNLISKGDTVSATKHLEFWEKEIEGNYFDNINLKNLLTIENELVGIYRQTSNKDKGLNTINKIINLIDKLDIKDHINTATIYTNIATAYKVFMYTNDAIFYYNKALDIYKTCGYDNKMYEYASLLNNYALALIDILDYDNALSLFFNAIDILKEIKNKELEIAMTYLNIATLYDAKDGIEGSSLIEENLDKAKDIFENSNITRDSYYAFVVSKAKTVYEYFGYFIYAKELDERERKIYERARAI